MSDNLDDIPTHWPDVNDPIKVIARYASAIRAYLRVLLPLEQDAHDVEQNLMVKLLEGKIAAKAESGRFRAYLKTIIRNEAITYLRRQRPTQAIPDDLPEMAQVWDSTYAACLLASVWRHFRDRATANPNEYGVLRLAMDHPGASAATLAAEWARARQAPYRVATFRKQLSRSRRIFAQLLQQAVARDLADPSPAEITAELRQLGLWSYVAPYLKPLE